MNEPPNVLAALRQMIDGGTVAKLSNAGTVAYLVLAVKFRNRDGFAWPGVQLLAQAIGLGDSATRAALRELRSVGLIVEQQRGRRGRKRGDPGIASVWRVVLPQHRRNSDADNSNGVGKPTVLPMKRGITPSDFRSDHRRNSDAQQPIGNNPLGVSKETVGRRFSDGITIPSDALADTGKLLALFAKYAERGTVTDCDADRLDFVASAESVLRVKNGNAPALFAERLKNWPKRRGWVSQVDEENAARRLRAVQGT
jgi:hypothetical protein